MPRSPKKKPAPKVLAFADSLVRESYDYLREKIARTQAEYGLGTYDDFLLDQTTGTLVFLAAGQPLEGETKSVEVPALFPLHVTARGRCEDIDRYGRRRLRIRLRGGVDRPRRGALAG